MYKRHYRWIVDPEILGRLNDAGLQDVATFLERFNKWCESPASFGLEMESVLSAFDHLVTEEALDDLGDLEDYFDSRVSEVDSDD